MIKGKFILDKYQELLGDENTELREFLVEFHYALTYLSRFMKVRPFTVYMLLFKEAYFNQGKKKIEVNLSKIGENLLSDVGRPMSYDVIKRGVNDLVKLGVVEKDEVKAGQSSNLVVKLPSELREVREAIKADQVDDQIVEDDLREDFYTNPEKRIQILKRDDHKCFYCLKELDETNYYLDHISPRSKGGRNYQSNLVASCKSCNTKKNDQDCHEFLLGNYRNSLLAQNEYLAQSEKLKKLISEYASL